MTTIAGFGSLYTSSFPGLKSVGMVALFGTLYSMITTLTFLIAVLTIMEKRKRKPESKMGSIGAGELLLIFLVALLLFGPGRLPELGRALGKAAREFKKAEAEVRNAMAAGTNDDPKGAPPSEKDPGERSE